ncbi:hypothetical protein EVAR_11142_1 [Eumeta japonica]|uniref:Uncharacterized protein n=1 Tax=Eumeta variegata TaxID=151549 RepID=A0A4C1U486_EUMVA|nr:hypothetical protein EVAR_11142_1 [Eumeta japonica]
MRLGECACRVALVPFVYRNDLIRNDDNGRVLREERPRGRRSVRRRRLRCGTVNRLRQSRGARGRNCGSGNDLIAVFCAHADLGCQHTYVVFESYHIPVSNSKDVEQSSVASGFERKVRPAAERRRHPHVNLHPSRAHGLLLVTVSLLLRGFPIRTGFARSHPRVSRGLRSMTDRASYGQGTDSRDADERYRCTDWHFRRGHNTFRRGLHSIKVLREHAGGRDAICCVWVVYFVNLCCAQTHVVDVKEIPTLKRCCSSGFHVRWNSSTKNGTDLKLGVRALLIIARLTVDEETVQRCWFPRMCNSSMKNGTDLRLGVRVLLIIARLTVAEKTVQRRWFPCTVELFDEERHRLETLRTGAAHHQWTDCGRENGSAALVSVHSGTLRRRTVQT